MHPFPSRTSFFQSPSYLQPSFQTKVPLPSFLSFFHMQHGKGIYFFHTGDRYEGAYVQGERTGAGIYYPLAYSKVPFPSRTSFFQSPSYLQPSFQTKVPLPSGDWKDDMQHGKGIYFFHTGDRYEGAYVQGERTGAGIYI